jgi:hypothetical protein
VLFNFAVVFLFSYMYLGGGHKFFSKVKLPSFKSMQKGKGNKVARQQENVQEEGGKKEMEGGNVGGI